MANILIIDDERPIRNTLKEILEYLEIEDDYFHKRCNDFRSPHLWNYVDNNWHLRHTVNKDGTDD